jgi:hypothetical protein
MFILTLEGMIGNLSGMNRQISLPNKVLTYMASIPMEIL